MPRGVYIRTKSLAGLKKKRIRNSASRKKKADTQQIDLCPVTSNQLCPSFIERTIALENVKDDYYLSYYQSKMQAIESQIIHEDDGTFSLVIQHEGYLLSLKSNDEDTIIFTRQATIGLISEMDRKGVSMEFYQECITIEGQKKYGLYQ